MKSKAKINHAEQNTINKFYFHFISIFFFPPIFLWAIFYAWKWGGVVLNVTMKMFHVELTSVWEQKLEWTALIWRGPPLEVELDFGQLQLVRRWGRSPRCHGANGNAGGVAPLKLPTSSTGNVIIQPTAEQFTTSLHSVGDSTHLQRLRQVQKFKEDVARRNLLDENRVLSRVANWLLLPTVIKVTRWWKWKDQHLFHRPWAEHRRSPSWPCCQKRPVTTTHTTTSGPILRPLRRSWRRTCTVITVITTCTPMKTSTLKVWPVPSRAKRKAKITWTARPSRRLVTTRPARLRAATAPAPTTRKMKRATTPRRAAATRRPRKWRSRRFPTTLSSWWPSAAVPRNGWP